MKKITLILVALTFFSLTGCSKIQVSPRLDSSLSYEAFSRMKCLKVKDASIALYLDPNLVNAKCTQSIKMGNFSFDLGKAIAVKFIKGMSYQFKTIYLVDKPAIPKHLNAQALMRVSLQDIDTKMDVHTGFSSVSAESYTRLAIRAEIKDLSEKRIVWVGTTQVSQSRNVNEMMLTYSEAGRGFAAGFNDAVDKAVGDLLYQMNKSQNLKKYFIKWEDQQHEK